MTGNSDGQVVAPVGSASGPIAKAEMWIRTPDGDTRPLRTMSNALIFPGEVVCTKGQGGGGWGDPLDRDVKRVQDDVIDRYVSKERAREIYGVVLDPNTLEIDYQTTKTLRREKKSKK
jgi:N-methylhydantoinase B